jgi:hypothetical protein
MAAPLEFKRRVRLGDAFPEPRPERQRGYGPLLGASVWLVVVGLAVAISEGVVPVERWLQPAIAEQPRPATTAQPRAASAPRTVRAAAQPPAAPASLPPAEVDRREPEPEPLASLAPPPPTLAPAELSPFAPPEPVPAPPEPDTEPAAAPEMTRAPSLVASLGTSCEQAAAEAVQEIEIGGAPAAPDLAREDYAAILERGSYFSACGTPDSMRVEICAAVRAGRAVGVTVRTQPGSRRVADCVARAVRSLAFPSHPRLDVVRTSFAPR